MQLKTAIATFTIAMLPGFALAQSTPATPGATAATPATSATPSDKSGARIDMRQDNQQKRIDAGVKSGELNKKEAARMQKGQERVQHLEDKARADGTVTKKEAARIEHAQDRQSKKIAREKHDNQQAK